MGYDINPGGTQLFAVQISFLGLAWVSILFRAYVRIHMIKKVSLDDYLMFAAVLIYTGYAIIAVWGIIGGGTGQHFVDIKPAEAAQALEAWFLCEVIYAPLSALVRTSIGVFLLRIATNKTHRAIIYSTIIVIWILSVIYFFLMMFQCSPPSYFWEQVYHKSGSCMDLNVIPAATIAHSVISAVCDFILALLPVAMMWNVQLNKRTKVTVAALLSMGLIAGVALIVRIPYVKFLAISSDFLFETIDVAIWSVMEPSLGIIAGCIATLRPLFKSWGFGPNNSARNYASKDKSVSGGGSRSTWRQTRGMLKLRDELTMTGSSDKPAQASDLSSSDIELVYQGSGEAPSDANTSLGSWDTDLEQGRHAVAGQEAAPSVVRVRTSIDITSHSRPDTGTAAERIANQERQVVSINGSETGWSP